MKCIRVDAIPNFSPNNVRSHLMSRTITTRLFAKKTFHVFGAGGLWGGGNAVRPLDLFVRQAAVVEAQAAVHRQRTGAAGDAQPLGTPNAGSSRDDPEGDVKQPLNASTSNDREGRKVEGGVTEGEEEDGNGASRREGGDETLLEFRKREEAEALSSQLQLIAAYLVSERNVGAGQRRGVVRENMQNHRGEKGAL